MDVLVFMLIASAVIWFALVRPVLRDLRADMARREAIRRVHQEADEANQTIHRITQAAQAAILRSLVERRTRP